MTHLVGTVFWAPYITLDEKRMVLHEVRAIVDDRPVYRSRFDDGEPWLYEVAHLSYWWDWGVKAGAIHLTKESADAWVTSLVFLTNHGSRAYGLIHARERPRHQGRRRAAERILPRLRQRLRASGVEWTGYGRLRHPEVR